MASHFKGPVYSDTNMCPGMTSTATAAGTTTLLANCSGVQVFTGSTTQTVKLPPAYSAANGTGFDAQLPIGYAIKIWNESSGTVTVQDSAAGAVGTVATTVVKVAMLTANTTTAGTWVIR